MKRVVFSILFTALSTVAGAGIGAAAPQSAIVLPEPFTIFICAGGLALLTVSFKRTR